MLYISSPTSSILYMVTTVRQCSRVCIWMEEEDDEVSMSPWRDYKSSKVWRGCRKWRAFFASISDVALRHSAWRVSKAISALRKVRSDASFFRLDHNHFEYVLSLGCIVILHNVVHIAIYSAFSKVILRSSSSLARLYIVLLMSRFREMDQTN